MKKVSVIIPVYKVEKYIAATVKSVLAQTYKNFELLLIDDGSPDNSIDICQKNNDPRISSSEIFRDLWYRTHRQLPLFCAIKRRAGDELDSEKPVRIYQWDKLC